MHHPIGPLFAAAGLLLAVSLSRGGLAAEPPATAAPNPAAAAGDVAAKSHPAPPPKRPAAVSVPHLEAALRAEKTDRGLRLVMPADRLFASPADTALDDEAANYLAPLGQLVAAVHPHEIVVAGHTDSLGDDDANLALSKERARAVAAWLAARAPKHPPRIVEQGYGRTRPVAPNHNADGSDNPAGRASNRRIEILLRR